jgi:hypothetical protein
LRVTIKPKWAKAEQYDTLTLALRGQADTCLMRTVFRRIEWSGITVVYIRDCIQRNTNVYDRTSSTWDNLACWNSHSNPYFGLSRVHSLQTRSTKGYVNFVPRKLLPRSNFIPLIFIKLEIVWKFSEPYECFLFTMDMRHINLSLIREITG